MAITSSSYSLGAVNVDGRRYVVERYLDSTGSQHLTQYLADPGADYAAILLVHLQAVENDLATSEAEQIING